MKLLKNLLLLVLISCSSIQSYSQQTIVVKTIDSLQHSTIQGSTIQVRKAGALIFKKSTNENGELRLSVDGLTKYELLIQHVAYHTKKVIIDQTILKDSTLIILLHPIQHVIDSIWVNAERIKYEPDRTIFSVHATNFSVNQDLTAVLKSIPTITVINSEVRIMGEKNIAFFFNGKEVDYDFVKLLPAKSIGKIEIIEPNVKYKEGQFRVINILSNKSLDGYQATANQVVGTRKRLSSLLNIKLQKNRFALIANAQFHKFRNEGSHRSTKIDSDREELLYTGNRTSEFKNLIFNTNLDYRMDSTSYLGLYVKYANTPTRSNIATKQILTDFQQDLLSTSKEQQQTLTTSLEFRKIFHHTSTLIGNFHYRYSNQKDVFNLLQNVPSTSRNAIRTNNIILQLDYTTQKKRPLNYTIGSKYTRRINQNNFGWANNLDQQNQNENILSTYVEGKWKNKWVDINSVLNMEMYRGNLQKLSNRKIDYTNFLHSITLSKRVSTQHILRLNIFKVVYRPSMSMLSTFRNNQDINTLKVGNAKLKQETQQTVRLSYNTKITDLDITISNTLRFTDNEMSPNFSDKDDRISRSFININRKITYTPVIAFSYDHGWFTQQLNFSYNYTKIKDDNLLISNKKQNTFNVLYNCSFSLPRAWSLEGSILYDMGINYFQTKTKGYTYADLSVNKEYKNLRLTLEYLDIFNQSSNYINTIYLDKTYLQTIRYKSNVLRFKIAYSLGKDFAIKTTRSMDTNDIKDLH